MEINSNSLPSLEVRIYGNAFHAMCLECGDSKAFEMAIFCPPRRNRASASACIVKIAIKVLSTLILNALIAPASRAQLATHHGKRTTLVALRGVKVNICFHFAQFHCESHKLHLNQCASIAGALARALTQNIKSFVKIE